MNLYIYCVLNAYNLLLSYISADLDTQLMQLKQCDEGYINY